MKPKWTIERGDCRVCEALLFVLCALLLFCIGADAAFAQVYSENFENNPDITATGAKSYTTTGGATQYVGTTPAGQTYTGSADWIEGNHCNGVVLSAGNSTAPAWATGSTKCNAGSSVQSYNAIRTLARAMGTHFGGGDNNHVVSSYTECPSGICGPIPSGQTNGVMFRTDRLIPVTANHFYAVSVDVGAMNCGLLSPDLGDPQFQFQLFDAANTTINIGTPLNACATPRTTVTVNNLQTGAVFPTTRTVVVSTLTTTSAIKYTGTSMGVQMYNVNGATYGNDAAFDNIRVVDVTPRISKAFSPSTVNSGRITTSTLTFTITNTPDNLAKPGWSFTDTLPAPLVLANTTVGGTCRNFANTGAPAELIGTAGSASITIRGSLPAVASCTVTVNVQVPATIAPGTYQNCAANFSALSFINPPTACATLNVVLGASIIIVKDAVPNSPQDFSFSFTSGSGTVPFQLDDDGDPTLANSQVIEGLPAGSYTVSEAAAAGWNLTGLTCTDPTGNSTDNPGTRTATINLAAGEQVTCTFTNSLPQVDLVLTKTNTPGVNGNVDQPSDTVRRGSPVEYSIVVRNNGPTAANNAVLRDPPPPGLTCSAVSCGSAMNGAVCPTPLTLTALQSSGGVAIPTLPATGELTFTLTCTAN